MPDLKRADCVHNPIAIEAEWWLPQTPKVRVRGKLSGRVASDLLLATEGNLGDDFHEHESTLIILGWRSACKADPLRRGNGTHLGLV